MPKYRKLHVRVLESFDFNEMPDDFTRLTWVLLPLVCDKNGCAPYSAQLLRSKMYPLREDVTTEMVARAMGWYESRGMIRRYRADGREFFFIPTFRKYQGDTSREGESYYPPPTDDTDCGEVASNSGVSHELLASNSRPTHEQVASNSCLDVDVDVDVDVDADVVVGAAATTTETPTDDEIAEVVKLYTNSTHGTVSSYLVDMLTALVRECEEHRLKLPRGSPGADVSGAGWVKAAIESAVQSSSNGRINYRFLESIITRWEREGFMAPMRSTSRKPDRNAGRAENGTDWISGLGIDPSVIVT